MAVSSGSFRTTGYSDPNSPDHYVFSWTLKEQNIANNYSVISWSLYADGGSGTAWWNTVKQKYVTVNGETQSNATAQTTYNGTTPFSGNTTIYHNSDGTKSFSASAGGAFEYYGAYNSTGSGSWELPTIPRATKPTFSALSATMGGSITITLTPASSTFKHKLRYSWSTLTQQVTGFSEGNNFTPQGNRTVTFTPPTSLANYIPNNNSGTCTVQCYTYDANGNHIGTVSTNITLAVPSYTPTVSLSITGNNLLSSAYVQNKSTMTVTVTAASSYGATIVGFSSVVDGKTYTSQSFTTSPLSSGSKTVSTTITDSRGKTATYTSPTYTVYAYAAPQITSFTLERQSNDETTVIATVKGTISAVNNKNAKTIKVILNGVTNTITSSAYTINGTTTFTNVPTDVTLIGSATFTDSYTTVKQDSVLPTVAVTMDFHYSGKGIAMGKVAEKGNLLDVAWDMQVNGNINGVKIGTDNYVLGGSRDTITDENWIAKAPSFIGTYNQNDQWYSTLSLRHRNGLDDGTNYGLQLRSILTQEDNLSWRQNINGSWKGWKTLLDSNNTADYVIEQGTSGIWTYRKWNSGVAECWGIYTMTSACTKAWGSLYYSDKLAPRINYPFTFTSRPQETIFCRGDSVSAWAYPEGGGIGMNTTTQTGSYGFLRPTTMTEAQVRYEFTVIGRWK